MKSPLRKRLTRELKSNLGKYIALFMFLVFAIAFISGFLVADGSMKKAYDDSFDKYNVEDGHFTLATEATDQLLNKVEAENVKVYQQFYKDVELGDSHTIRIYEDRQDVNEECLMNGRMPEGKEEIAIDRLYASNNEIEIGDSISVDGTELQVVGLVALSDYSALFKNNTDMMLDANKFAVSVVTEAGFDKVGTNPVYCYSWCNDDKSLSETDSSDKADDIKDVLSKNALITDFVKRADNSAIEFTGNDMGSDKAMMTWLLYIVMVILAFIFAVTTKSTVEQEASVIGTLRASGYTRHELLVHYISMPIIVTLIAAIVGNILGYTVMKFIVADMYYHSYSLPTYVTIWSSEAFVKTTLIPCLIILVVNTFVLAKELRISPLQFLRGDLRKNKKKKAVRLPNFKFFSRFRIRIILQNLTGYLTLFIGLTLASLLLMFGLMMTPLLSNFKDSVIDSQIAEYQYILKAPVETTQKDAEKYSVTSLNSVSDDEMLDGEEITVYGISDNSEYLNKLDLDSLELANKDSKIDSKVIVSEGYLEKYKLKVGDKITLKEEFGTDEYTFTIEGTYDYPATLAVFMPRESFNETFDMEKNYFNGYFSNEELGDIDKDYIASTITQADLTVVADQLDDSLGNMFVLILGFATALYMLIIYLLAKIVVEKNTKSISMVKILGYTSGETSRLYNLATAIVVVLTLIISLPIDYYLMKYIYFIFMKEINGWLTFYIAPKVFMEMLGIGAGCYLVVHWLQSRKINKIPMSQVLKDME